jgi:SAM-dependent methyltransferase
MLPERRSHWEAVYRDKAENQVSWFQERPAISFDLITRDGLQKDAPIIDIGGGASRLVDLLLDAGFSNVTVLDIAESALERSRARLGARASEVSWIVADVTTWTPPRQYKVWHDRAALHFLVDPAARAAYRSVMLCAVEPGGLVVIATFAEDGPERCSGLPVQRFSPASLAAELGGEFQLIDSMREEHRTPGSTTQRFQFSRFRRL